MKYYKLGCNWGSGNPDFYEILLKHSIVICAGVDMKKGDYVAITKGHNVVALAQIKEDRTPSTNHSELEQDFNDFQIDYDSSNFVAKAYIWKIPKKEQFEYKLQQGICQIQNEAILNKIKTFISNIMRKEIVTDCVKLLINNKNLILTGAPGTGKTYLAKQIAKEMGCDEEHIEFVQFHPSYDYTDFVEGLRPIKQGGTVGFQRKDGVFKEFCKTALVEGSAFENINAQISIGTIEEAFKYLWERIRKKEITKLIQYGKNQVTQEMVVKEDNPDSIYFLRKNETFNSDTSVTLNKVTIAYYDRKIQSLEYLRSLGSPNREMFGSQSNASNTWAVMNCLLTLLEGSKSQNFHTQPYVFIIDEINRGEMSKIFGELFYSIDPGYRGEKGKVDTQYQNLIPKEGDDDYDPNNADVFRNGFYVPDNVYIIGTMNDIDRSVESMDFAMRRRFAWKEIKAKSRQSMLDENDAWKPYAKPGQNIIDEIKNRMDNLNACIIDQYKSASSETKDKIGLTKAYHIGASYFLKYGLYNNFDDLWNNHLDGLLREYLRGTTKIDDKIDRLKEAYNDTTAH